MQHPHQEHQTHVLEVLTVGRVSSRPQLLIVLVVCLFVTLFVCVLLIGGRVSVRPLILVSRLLLVGRIPFRVRRFLVCVCLLVRQVVFWSSFVIVVLSLVVIVCDMFNRRSSTFWGICCLNCFSIVSRVSNPEFVLMLV